MVYNGDVASSKTNKKHVFHGSLFYEYGSKLGICWVPQELDGQC